MEHRLLDWREEYLRQVVRQVDGSDYLADVGRLCDYVAALVEDSSFSLLA